MTVDITNVKYTTLDREVTFTFDFVQIAPGNWRIYIVHGQDYGTRSSSSVPSHRLTDQRGDYICWEPPPTTLDAAKGVARAWADATHVYVATGAFPAPGPSRFVPDISTSATWAHRNNPGEIPPGPAPQPPPARGLMNLFRRNP